MVRRKTIEEVRQAFSDGGCTLLAEKYVNANEKLQYICVCGNVSEIRFSDFQRGIRCRQCGAEKISKAKKHSLEYVKRVFEENGCELLGGYESNHSLVRYRCNCGNISMISFNCFQQGQRCKQCGIEKNSKSRKYSLEYVKQIFMSRGCELLSEYVNARTPVKYRCNCGTVSEISFTKFRLGQSCKQCGYEKITLRQIGENNPNYNAELTDKERVANRKYPEYRDWLKLVFARDKYMCQCCGDNRSGNLNAHHLDGYNWCKERRTDLSNGVTLCVDCHNDFHSVYGYGNNTEAQYNEWILAKITNEGGAV